MATKSSWGEPSLASTTSQRWAGGDQEKGNLHGGTSTLELAAWLCHYVRLRGA